MNDAPSPLESRLARLQPRALGAALEARIAGSLSESTSHHRGDRLLWSAMLSGAAAACVIVAMLFVEPARSEAPHVPHVPVAQSRPPSGDVPMLAWAGQRWGDELGPDQRWSSR